MMSLHRLYSICVLAGLGTAAMLVAAPRSADLSKQPLGKLPLAFERQGTAANPRYIGRGRGYGIALENNAKAILSLWSDRGDALAGFSVAFENAQPSSPRPGPELPGKVNYIHGTDPSRWQFGLPTFERVIYPNVYPEIDVVYYGNQQQLEFDLILKPGADARKVLLKFAGARKISLSPEGGLVLATAAGELYMPVPHVYQQRSGGKVPVSAHYVLRNGGEVAFEVGPYDRTKALVIDPTISYSTVLGGSDNGNFGSAISAGNAIAVDNQGDIYVSGYTYATDFPAVNAAQPGWGASGDPFPAGDAFVSKLNAAGTALIFSTYLGGSGFDTLQALAVDSTGAAWAAGYTFSTNFPLMNAYQSQSNGAEDAIVVKLSATGALEFSTYLGSTTGFAAAFAVAVDTSNHAYVAGEAKGPFPATSNVLQPSNQGGLDAFLAKFAPGGSLLYATLLGGASDDVAYGVAADSNGNAYVTGSTFSSSFFKAPAGGARTTNAGAGDAFVAKLNPTGSAMLYFTFLGGSGLDSATAIATESDGSAAYIAGNTESSDLNPTAGAVQGALRGSINGFVAKLDATGSTFLYITYLGGQKRDQIFGLALDAFAHDVYVTGNTDSSAFPLQSPIQAAIPNNSTSIFETTTAGSSWAPYDTHLPDVAVSLSPNPTTSGTLVAAAEQGIYRTTDHGATWTREARISGAQLTRSLASASTLYALTGSAVYQSTDGGLTWRFKGSTPTSPVAFVPDPLTANIVYYSDTFPFGNFYKSTNGGASWTAENPPFFVSPFYYFIASSDGFLYALSSFGGLFKSTDQGATWSPADSGIGPASLLSLTSSASDPKTLYGTDGTSIFRTTDGGANWAKTAATVPAGISLIAASPSNSSIVYAVSPNVPVVSVTTDGGKTWNAGDTGLGYVLVNQLAFGPTSSDVFAVPFVVKAGFVAKINSTGTQLIYSTYLAGLGNTLPSGIVTNGRGDAFVTGSTAPAGTAAAGIPLTASAFQSAEAFPFALTAAFITRISDLTAACSYTVKPGSSVVTSSVQTLTYGVVAPSGCAWTASTDQPWATIASDASASGTAVLSVEVAANTSGAARTGNLSVQGQTIAIRQADSSCSFSLDSYFHPVTSAGGMIPVQVSAGPGCPWTVNNTSPDLSIVSGSPGTGNGTVMLAVAPYAGLNPRSMSLTVAGNHLTIGQAGDAITIVVTGPGATSTPDSFESFTNQVTLNASGSTSSTGGPLTYSWTIARGSNPAALIGANTAVVTAQFPFRGTYQLTLAATDLSGNTATANITYSFIDSCSYRAT